MEVRWRVSGFREIAFIVVGASGGAGPLCFVDAGGVVDDRIRDHVAAVSRGIETFPAAFTCRHVKRGD